MASRLLESRASCDRLMVIAGVLLALAGALSTTLADDSPQVDRPSLGQTINQLISQLGDEDFAQREKAQGELEQLGLIAFDALRDAVENDDIEVALRARYILRAMQIRWVRETDPREVRELLKEYDEKPFEDRQALMGQLETIPGGRGIPALCRIARFDPSLIASKRAALLVIQKRPAPGIPLTVDLAQAISDEIGFSERPAADWLRLFARTLDDPASTIAAWNDAVRTERRTLSDRPDRTSTDIVTGLMRYQANLLAQADREEQSAAIMREIIDELDGDLEGVIETVDWLIDRKAWALVSELAAKYPELVDGSSQLNYRLAEAALMQEDLDSAQKLADRALEINAEDQEEHILTAYEIAERGHYDWAEREYRQVMKQGPLGSAPDLKARLFLSELLHDLERDDQAADALRPAAELMENDAVLTERLKTVGRSAEGVASRMHYFQSEWHRQQGDIAAQREELGKAIEQDPTDADVLIAMYRMKDADQSWRKATQDRIRATAEEFRRQIRMAEQLMLEARLERDRAELARGLAMANNQFAWLISNTIGDYQEALRCSHRSLELRPNSAGYFDTLGRCYFAIGDLEHAVKYQQMAVSLEPHTQQIRRQLKLFEEASNGSSGSTHPEDETE